MIVGSVTPSGDAIVELTLFGPKKAVKDLPVIVDTGFTEYLAVPARVISALELQSRQFAEFTLADGSVTQTPTFVAEVGWLDGTKTVTVYEVDGPALLGMKLLIQSRLQIDVVPGGRVEIDRLE